MSDQRLPADRKITVMDQQMEGENLKLLMLSVNGQAVGSCQIASWNEDRPCILGIVIDPQHRRRGHATAIILTAIEAAKKDGKAGFSLGVETENEPAIGLYHRLGFTIELQDPSQLWMSIRFK